MTNTAYKSMKELPGSHVMAGGTGICAGCGGLEAIKMLCDVLGANTIVVNAAGCMTLLSVYPHTPFPGSWLYTAMASAPAGGQGVRDALDILEARAARTGAPRREKTHVLVLTGDGSANGMGLSATSAAMDRRLDFWYLCYDNEGYGNTGQQTSAATPHGAHTSTDPGGFAGEKKNLFAIWAAHNPSYLATITAAEPVDLARKVAQARELEGPRMFIALAPCPTGWHFAPRDSVKIGRLAVKTGMFPLKTFINGRIEHTRPPQARGRRPPVEQYLELQGRFAHLFHPRRDEARLAEIQRRVDMYWEAVGVA
ncbi:MAG: thiamine pyrophosphate-dependent enzyme [Deltaproteobacteria bacterium]|nr:thiamine pyrophosphate-dependent enzyme [Deltaproteobacteria bacterium]